MTDTAPAAPPSTHPPVTTDEFAACMQATGAYDGGVKIAVGVSGGADSLALLLLLHDWAANAGTGLTALTVDHGLRAAARTEAEAVARLCGARGIAHVILDWTGDKPAHGIQAAARRARYSLMEDWCRRNGVGDLCVAHTQNDQAETFLLRMSRGSGLDGLAAMPLVGFRDPIRLVRPLLNVPRGRLEATLRDCGQTWTEDPSNRDRRYARVRLRRRAAELESRGIPTATIAAAARIFGELRHARETVIAGLADRIVTLHPEGFADIDRTGLRRAAPEIAPALTAALISLLGGGDYPPRRERLDRAMKFLTDDAQTGNRTLGNCILSATRDRIRICREPRTIRDKVTVTPGGFAMWDGRFAIRFATGLPAGGLELSALGEDGWQSISADTGDACRAVPGPVRYALPAIRRDGEIIEVRHLGYRAPQVIENIIETAQFRRRSPVSGPPFWVA